MTTSEPLLPLGLLLTESRLTRFVGDSHAKTLALRERVRELTGRDLDYGQNTPVWLASYDLNTLSWRTSQLSLEGGLSEFSETWPRSGMMQNGIAYQLPPLVRLTSEIGFGLLPTPNAQMGATVRNTQRKDNGSPEHTQTTLFHQGYLPTCGANESKGSSRKRFKGSPHFRGAKTSEGLRTSFNDPIYLNPCFGELMMGYPIEWTRLEMPSSRKSQR